MAARENFSLQVALIIFVILTLGLAITTYVNFRAAEEAKLAKQSAIQAKDSAEKARDTAMFQRDYLKYMIGEGTLTKAELDTMKASVAADPEFDKIITKFENDMVTYGEGLPETDQNYANLPSWLITTIQQKLKQVADMEVRENEMLKEVEDVKKAEKARTEKALEAEQTAAQDLLQVRTDFEKSRKDFTTRAATAASQIDELNQKIASIQASADKQTTEARKEIAELENLRDLLTDRIEKGHQENFDVADGRIAWVDQRSNKVWLALGMADGLRPQITFSVYSKAENNIDKTNIKARVEVTRVVDQSLSEARILEDVSSDPILPGDVVYSPVWRPGRRIRFALIGNMDVDDDGKSDRAFVRNLITMNGGVIDAELHEDGTPTGKITANTRYLVKGERPTDQDNDKVVREYSRMVKEAEGIGVQEINLDELLSLMGWKPEVQTVPLGDDADTRFRARQPAGSSSAPGGNGGAYPNQ